MPFSTIIRFRASTCAFVHVPGMVGGAYRSVHLPFHPTCVLRFGESICVCVRWGMDGTGRTIDWIGLAVGEWVALPLTLMRVHTLQHTLYSTVGPETGMCGQHGLQNRYHQWKPKTGQFDHSKPIWIRTGLSAKYRSEPPFYHETNRFLLFFTEKVKKFDRIYL
jgi:hypothetical protein